MESLQPLDGLGESKLCEYFMHFAEAGMELLKREI